MTDFQLPVYAAGQPASAVGAALRQALAACDRAQECAVLWFAEVQRRSLYRQLGHASLQLYATQALGFSDNRYWAFKRLADDLDRLPALKVAVEAGDVGWTKDQLVGRVATAATAGAWVAKAATIGRREPAREVKAARRPQSAAPALPLGDAPAPVATPPAAMSTTIALHADALQLAQFEAAVEKAHKPGLVAAGADRLEIVLAALDALVATGPATNAAKPCGPGLQVVVQQCPDCGRAAAVTSRGEKPLAPAQIAAVACDARVRVPGGANRAGIPPKIRAFVLARDRHRCTIHGCGATRFLEVHHVLPRRAGGSNRTDNLVTLCGRCHRFAHAKEAELASAQVRGGQRMAAASTIAAPQTIAVPRTGRDPCPPRPAAC